MRMRCSWLPGLHRAGPSAPLDEIFSCEAALYRSRDGKNAAVLLSRTRDAINVVNLATPVALLLARVAGTPVTPGPDGLLIAAGYRWPQPAAGAFTVGNVIFTRGSAEELLARPLLLAHESRHASQWAVTGPLFLPMYGAASAWSWLRHGDYASGNLFEQAAGLRSGGYAARPVRPASAILSSRVRYRRRR